MTLLRNSIPDGKGTDGPAPARRRRRRRGAVTRRLTAKSVVSALAASKSRPFRVARGAHARAHRRRRLTEPLNGQLIVNNRVWLLIADHFNLPSTVSRNLRLGTGERCAPAASRPGRHRYRYKNVDLLVF
ncbi:hypothetical protein EVAR_71262_1 [Eumeta japonica]|uniref:Uncharacterized protein n=1 Tax=Eumeta variegata TaxID=151549 RepID=A0A4C1SVA6_EUMVA|nr:hypothetical protein EVAR_71262_1 [Eumeta japonica]